MKRNVEAAYTTAVALEDAVYTHRAKIAADAYERAVRAFQEMTAREDAYARLGRPGSPILRRTGAPITKPLDWQTKPGITSRIAISARRRRHGPWLPGGPRRRDREGGQVTACDQAVLDALRTSKTPRSDNLTDHEHRYFERQAARRGEDLATYLARAAKPSDYEADNEARTVATEARRRA